MNRDDQMVMNICAALGIEARGAIRPEQLHENRPCWLLPGEREKLKQVLRDELAAKLGRVRDSGSGANSENRALHGGRFDPSIRRGGGPETMKTKKAKTHTRTKAAAAKATVARMPSRPKGGDSDRGLYVRFDSPAMKAKVKAAADKTGVSMNAYIVAATFDWVDLGRTLPQAVKKAS